MKCLAILLAAMLVCGCQTQQRHTDPKATLDKLTGTVIRKGWTKSGESWNAGGSEYYVLRVAENELPSGRRTAKEGVILRPSEAVPFDSFANYVGRVVTCQGEYVSGEPYKPREDLVEQVPMMPDTNPFTGEIEYPTRGSGFKVQLITPVDSK